MVGWGQQIVGSELTSGFSRAKHVAGWWPPFDDLHGLDVVPTPHRSGLVPACTQPADRIGEDFDLDIGTGSRRVALDVDDGLPCLAHRRVEDVLGRN